MESSNFFSESNATSTVDASVHVGDDHRPDILILNCSFEFVMSGSIEPIVKGVVLEIALAALIADRTIQGMVSQDEFHDSASGNSGSL